jgi:hypothetical protein
MSPREDLHVTGTSAVTALLSVAVLHVLSAQEPQSAAIRRLDGTTIATTAAELFASATLILKAETMKAMLTPFLPIRSLHQFPLAANEPESAEAAAVGLAYGVGWGLLTRTPFGPAFFKEGHGDGAQLALLRKSAICVAFWRHLSSAAFCLSIPDPR